MNFTFLLALLSSLTSFASINVLTQHNDNARSGVNSNESLLSPLTVNSNQFGKLFTRAVDGQIYAQPLVFQDQVIVATEHNSVYAFDGLDRTKTTPIWQVNLGPSVLVRDTPFQDDHTLMPEIGITGTPVIDPDSRTLFVEAATHEHDGYHHRLHALDLSTGLELRSVEIGGQANGLIFDALLHRQRPALVLAPTPWGGRAIHIAFGSQDDFGESHGWMFAFDADSFQSLGAFVTTSHGSNLGSIWMSGQGPTADDEGNVYVMSGNGEGDITPANFSESFLKLGFSSSGYSLQDWFTPFDRVALDKDDIDLGSGGTLLLPGPLPGTQQLLGGGKSGKFYVMDSHQMGHFHDSGDTQIIQSFQATNGPIFSSPVYWNSKLYVWAVGDSLRSLSVNNGKVGETPLSVGSATSIYPGGALSLSSNGLNSGIVWASRALSGDGHGGIQEGVLQALDASDVTHELWSSDRDPQDTLGTLAKYCPPTIANGRVYMATFSNELVVYGPKQ